VAQTVAQYGGSDAMIAAAYLHDTLEDTDTSYDRLAAMFGVEVADLVLAVTDVSKPADGNRATRKALDCTHLATGSADAQTIKLADLIDNTSSIVEHDPDFAKIYLVEKAALLEVLTKGDRRLHAIASELAGVTP